MTTWRLQRGSVGPAGPPGTSLLVSGPNYFGGETLRNTFVSTLISLQNTALSSTADRVWLGYHGFVFVPTGNTPPSAQPGLSGINDPGWLWWAPITLDPGAFPVWYNAGASPAATYALPWYELRDKQLKTERVVPSGGGSLWWSGWFINTPASTTRVWYAWSASSSTP